MQNDNTSPGPGTELDEAQLAAVSGGAQPRNPRPDPDPEPW